jgi:tetratricopeptide (TPR) repeat protein
MATIQRIGSQIFGDSLGGHKEPYPLLDLDGFNAYHVDRLALDGIENQQNMAGASIVDLMLRTRYTVEQIVDWIDQSLLHLHARERIVTFKKCGYRTATDFLDAFYGIEQADQAALGEWRKKMASLLLAQLPADEGTPLNLEQIQTLMGTVASSLQYAPNFFHVRYWRRHEYEALPEDVERFRTEADLKLMQGLKDEAIEAYKQVLDQFPNSLTTRLYLGLAYYQLGDYQKAINQYERLIEQSSSQRKTAVTAYIEQGSAYRELGEFEKARASYEKVFELDRDNLEAHLDLAYLQMSRLSEYSQAIDHLNAAIEGDFRKADALATRGLARLELWKRSRTGSEPVSGNPSGLALLEEARSDLQQALRLNPDLIAAYINLVLVYQEAGNFSEALDRLEEVIRRLEKESGKPPEDLENAYRARLLRGNIYIGLGDLQAAVDNYRIATRIAPYDAAAFYNLGVAYQQLARSKPEALEEAHRAFQEVVFLKPGHAPAHQALGSLQCMENQNQEAEISFKTALRLSRERGDIKGQSLARLSLGKLYRLSSRIEEARRELNESSKLADEQNDDLTYTEATFELALLDFAAAQAAAVKDTAAFGRAAALLETASALFEALNLPRQAARAFLMLGKARSEEGKTDEAKQAWEQAKKMFDVVFEPTNPDDILLRNEIDAARVN